MQHDIHDTVTTIPYTQTKSQWLGNIHYIIDQSLFPLMFHLYSIQSTILSAFELHQVQLQFSRCRVNKFNWSILISHNTIQYYQFWPVVAVWIFLTGIDQISGYMKDIQSTMQFTTAMRQISAGCGCAAGCGCGKEGGGYKYVMGYRLLATTLTLII